MQRRSCSKKYFFNLTRDLIIGSLSSILVLLLLVSPVYPQEPGIESLRKTGKAFATVAKRVSPAVVFIQVEKMVNQPAIEFFSPFGGDENPFGDDFFRHFFGEPSPHNQSPQQPRHPNQKQREVGQGSGFIVSADGYILTNNHVVGGADRVIVKLEDGREFKAKTIGTDPHTDVAVIKIEANNLPVLPLGDSDALEVGEWVMAIGNPFGLSHTLTAGIVSAKGRSSLGIADYENFIQTDAAINPGNSGGPLVNLEGEAVGMNTAIFSRSGGYMGVGFAIPINMAKAIMDQLIKHGSVTRGYLGIVIQDLTPDLAKTFELEGQKGILISQVTEDSPAQKAGLKRGDVIVEYDGEPVGEIAEFRNRVSLETPGTKHEITLLRDGKHKNLTVTIGKLPDKEQVASAPPHSWQKLGITVKNLTRDLAQRFGYQGETGVVVTDVDQGSVADMAGIQAGTLIKEVNRKAIRNVNEFQRAIEESSDKNTVLLLIQEGESMRYVALSIEE
jgi:serine protease Do